MKIRLFEKKDVKDVLKIITKTMPPEDTKYAEKVFKIHFGLKKLKIEWTEYVVAVEKDKILGICGLYYYGFGRDTYGIGWFAVDPKYQNKGIGTKLLEKSENMIKDLGGRIIFVFAGDLKTSKEEITFYKNRGYKREAVLKDFYLEGENAVVLSKKI